MKCKHLRIRTKNYKKYPYCTIYKKEVKLYCKCPNQEFKINKSFKKRSNKQNSKEKDRFSIIYFDLNKCCECGLKEGDFDSRINGVTYIEKNEVFEGSYRNTSIKYGMVTPFCIYCHKKFHSNRLFNLRYKILFQNKFLETHSLKEFLDLFKIDYRYRK